MLNKAIALLWIPAVTGVTSLASLHASAQTTPEVVVISHTPLPGAQQSAERYPGHVQVVGDAQIERSKTTTLPEFMQQQLGGVTINEVQGSPFQVDVFYRGQRLSPTLGNAQGLSVYVDGVRVNEAFGDVMNWDMLPESAVSSLALMPGSNPLFGLNTLGGALVLNTKSGHTHAGTEAEISMGAKGRKRFDWTHGVKLNDGYHALIAGTLFSENGLRERSEGRLGNVFAKWGRQINDTDWSVSYTHANSKLNGNGLLSQSLYDIHPKAGYTFTDTTRNTSNLLNAQITQTLSGNDKLTASMWTRQSKRLGVTGDINEDWVAYQTDPLNVAAYTLATATLNRTEAVQASRGSGLQWSGKRGNHNMAAGAELQRSRVSYDQFTQDAHFDAARVANPDPTAAETHHVSLRGTSRTASLFATDTLKVDAKTEVTLSARYNHTRVSNELGQPAPLVGESFTYSKLNPAVGLSHLLTEQTTLFGNLSQGTRVPTALELGCADPAKPCTLPTGLQSDPYLKQVVARTLEVGFRLKPHDRLKLSGAFFQTNSEDDIAFVRSGATQAGYFTNIGRTQRRGVELSARWREGAWQFRSDYLLLDATYQTTQDLPGPLTTTAANTVSKGTRMAGLPRQVVKFGFDWKATPSVGLGLDGIFSGSQVVAGNESGSQPALGKLAGYSVWNAKATWQVSSGWQVFGRINNVLDQRYATFATGNLDLFPKGAAAQAGDGLAASRFLAPGMGRTLYAGVRYDFD
jgi:outer membrane receptor protein involved in Fe transport